MIFLFRRNCAKPFPILLLLLAPFNFCQISEKSDEYKLYLKQYQESFSKGEQLLRSGEFLRAIKFYEQSLVLAEKSSDNRSQVKCWIQLGLLYWNRGNLDKSIEYYKKAQSVAEKFQFSQEYSDCSVAIEINRLYQKGKKSM